MFWSVGLHYIKKYFGSKKNCNTECNNKQATGIAILVAILITIAIVIIAVSAILQY